MKFISSFLVDSSIDEVIYSALIGRLTFTTASLMPRKSDREILVDPPSALDLHGVSKSSSFPKNPTSTGLQTFGRLKSWLGGDLSSTFNQLRVIYISIAACLAAISFALILTIFFGPPQVKTYITLNLRLLLMVFSCLTLVRVRSWVKSS